MHIIWIACLHTYIYIHTYTAHLCNVIEYLYSTRSRYLLRGTLRDDLYDVKCHYAICICDKIRVQCRTRMNAMMMMMMMMMHNNFDQLWYMSGAVREFIFLFSTDYWTLFRRQITRFVDHKYFQRGILLAILVNTLSMGIEFHNQVRHL